MSSFPCFILRLHAVEHKSPQWKPGHRRCFCFIGNGRHKFFFRQLLPQPLCVQAHNGRKQKHGSQQRCGQASRLPLEPVTADRRLAAHFGKELLRHRLRRPELHPELLQTDRAVIGAKEELFLFQLPQKGLLPRAGQRSSFSTARKYCLYCFIGAPPTADFFFGGPEEIRCTVELPPSRPAASIAPPEQCILFFEFPRYQKRSPPTADFFFGGPEEIRTPDPYNANVMRSQLRYGPMGMQRLYSLPKVKSRTHPRFFPFPFGKIVIR